MSDPADAHHLRDRPCRRRGVRRRPIYEVLLEGVLRGWPGRSPSTLDDSPSPVGIDDHRR